MYNQIDKKLEARIVKSLEEGNRRLADLQKIEDNVIRNLTDTIREIGRAHV